MDSTDTPDTTAAKRHIYGQGDLDGACFLYAVVNAYVALCGKAPQFDAVCAAFAQVDHPGDFLNGIVGTTGQYDGNYALLQDNLERVLSRLGGESFHVQRVEGPTDAEFLGALIGPQSVAVVRYQGNSALTRDMDHWVCAVAGDPQSGGTFVACSVRFQKSFCGSECRYAETFHPQSGRWSNDLLHIGGEVKLVEGEVFCVRVAG